MILKEEFIIKCQNCGFKRKSEGIDFLVVERDKHKNRNPIHKIDWFVRELTEKKIKSR